MISKVKNRIKNYGSEKLRKDFVAALTVSVVLIPQSMAYSILAGLPPIFGLYAALIPLFIYGIFGSSSILSVGPVALISIIIFGGIADIAELGSQNYLDLVLLTGFIAGLLQLVFYVLKFGKYADYLSEPLLSGFISAAGVIIIISQIKSLFTIPISRANATLDVFIQTMSHISDANLISAGLGVGAILLIYFFNKINKEIPGALIVVVLSSAVMYLISMNPTNVPTVGDLPMGLPNFYSGFLQLDGLIQVLPTAVVISIVCFVGSISIAKSISSDDNKIKANRELLALGLAKVGGSFFLSMPSSSSFSRSAINHNAGSQSGMSSIFASLILALVLLFLGSVFYYLPIPVLAAIIIMSVFGLIDIDKGIELWKSDKRAFSVFGITFLSTIVFGIISGIFIGLAWSLISPLLLKRKKQSAT